MRISSPLSGKLVADGTLRFRLVIPVNVFLTRILFVLHLLSAVIGWKEGRNIVVRLNFLQSIEISTCEDKHANFSVLRLCFPHLFHRFTSDIPQTSGSICMYTHLYADDRFLTLRGIRRTVADLRLTRASA